MILCSGRVLFVCARCVCVFCNPGLYHIIIYDETTKVLCVWWISFEITSFFVANPFIYYLFGNNRDTFFVVVVVVGFGPHDMDALLHQYVLQFKTRRMMAWYVVKSTLVLGVLLCDHGPAKQARKRDRSPETTSEMLFGLCAPARAFTGMLYIRPDINTQPSVVCDFRKPYSCTSSQRQKKVEYNESLQTTLLVETAGGECI